MKLDVEKIRKLYSKTAAQEWFAYFSGYHVYTDADGTDDAASFSCDTDGIMHADLHNAIPEILDALDKCESYKSQLESLASRLAWNLIAPRSGRGIAKNPEISIIQVPMGDVTPKSVETAVSGFFEEVRDLAPVIYWHLASQHENEAGVRVYKSGSTWVLEVAIEWEPMQ